MSNPIHILFFILITLFWGGSFLAIGISVERFPPFFAAFLRTFIGLIFVSVYLLLRRKEPKSAWHLRLQSMGSGLFIMGLAWVFLFWGEKYVSPALASILNGTVPIFTILLTPFITPQDKLSWNKWAGVFVGFAGVAVIFAPEISLGVTPHLQGLIALLMMSLCYGIGVLWTRRLSRQVDNATNLFYQSIGSALFLFLVSFVFELQHTTLHWSWSAIVSLVYLGVFSTAIAWLLFYRLVKELGSLQATAVTYCVPLVAIILDAVVLKKWIALHQAVGACIILAAVFLINRPSFLK